MHYMYVAINWNLSAVNGSKKNIEKLPKQEITHNVFVDISKPLQCFLKQVKNKIKANKNF